MGNYNLRKQIREILSEFFNNSWVYTYGPNKFPRLDGNEKTPDDLNRDFDHKFNFLYDEIEESEENTGFKKSRKKVKKKINFNQKG